MLSLLRKNKELYPVAACVVFGCILGGGYLLRMAVQHPDVAWAQKRTNFPWLAVKQTDQKKFYSSFDYSKRKDESPKLD